MVPWQLSNVYPWVQNPVLQALPSPCASACAASMVPKILLRVSYQNLPKNQNLFGFIRLHSHVSLPVHKRRTRNWFRWGLNHKLPHHFWMKSKWYRKVPNTGTVLFIGVHITELLIHPLFELWIPIYPHCSSTLYSLKAEWGWSCYVKPMAMRFVWAVIHNTQNKTFYYFLLINSYSKVVEMLWAMGS